MATIDKSGVNAQKSSAEFIEQHRLYNVLNNVVDALDGTDNKEILD